MNLFIWDLKNKCMFNLNIICIYYVIDFFLILVVFSIFNVLMDEFLLYMFLYGWIYMYNI